MSKASSRWAKGSKLTALPPMASETDDPIARTRLKQTNDYFLYLLLQELLRQRQRTADD